MADPRVAWLHGAVIAHRGAHAAGQGGAIENSPSAFAAAISQNLAIECDVQRTADGEAVVFHDPTLNRLTAERGPIAARTAADLGQIHLGDTPDTIPTLAATLAQIAGQVPLLIEIKIPAGQPHITLCRAVATALATYTGPHAVMSFDPRVPLWFARNHPTTPRGLILSDTPRRRFAALRRALAMRLAQPHFLALDIRDLPNPFAARQRAKGLPLATWTVRDSESLARARQHADAPIAEGPALAEAQT